MFLRLFSSEISTIKGHKVLVVESHDTPGGCAHGWERLGYHFESGPSLYSGLSYQKSPNPLKNIFQIIEEEPEWITYDRWGTVLPEGKFAAKIGPDEFNAVLLKYGGVEAVQEWSKIMNRLIGPNSLSEAAQATPSLALREDISAVISLSRYFTRLLKTLKKGKELNEPFSNILQELNIQNKFVTNWLDLLCFLLQGLPANGTMNAVVAYMMADWYRPGVTLDYPRGGSGAIVDALVRGLRRSDTERGQRGGHLMLRTHCEQILVKDGRACGVRLRDQRSGKQVEVSASVAVVSNVDVFNLRKLVPRGLCTDFDEAMGQFTVAVPPLASFIHLHAGIDATDLPTSPSQDLPAQWAVVRDWDLPGGVEAPRNVVLVSVPSLLDPSMAPPGKHVIHAYVPATEPYEWWSGLDRGSPEYKKKKEEAADFLWSAVEKYIPNARQLSDKRVEQIGTPLTHERFLRRSFGSYGPRVVAGESGAALPAHRTKLPGLWAVGDFTFPGIGVPAAAASGAIAANSIMSVWKHVELLDRIQLPES
eukprot:gene22163-30400_t